MRRIKKEKYSKKISSTYTIFKWQSCWICGQEFRREFGYKFITDDRPMRRPMPTKCICSVCAPDNEMANEIAIEYERKYSGTNMKPPRIGFFGPTRPPSGPKKPVEQDDNNKDIIDKLNKLEL